MISDNDPEYLTPEERLVFNKLNRQKSPPQSLEEKTIKALHSKNLLKPGTSTGLFTSWTLPKLSAVGVATAVIFLLGFTFGRWPSRENAAVPPQSLFALLIYDDDNYVGDPMAQGQEYRNWMFDMRAAGGYATGQKFLTSGRILKAGTDHIEVHELNAADSYGAIGGFFLIEASSYEEVVRVASSCPHLKYSGTIEVRKIHY